MYESIFATAINSRAARAAAERHLAALDPH